MGVLHSAAEVRSVVGQMGASVRLYPALCLSLACYWFWQASLFQNPLAFLGGSPVVPDGALRWPNAVLLACSLVAYVVLALAHTRLRPLFEARWYPPLIALLMGLGSAGALAGSGRLAAGGPGVLSAVSLGVLGVGAALFVCELGRLFAQLGPNRTLYVGGLGTLGGMLLNALAAALPHAALAGMLVVAALVAVALYGRARCGFSQGALFRDSYESLRSPRRLTVTCAVQGVAFGTFTALAAALPSSGVPAAVYLVACPVGVATLLVTFLAVRSDFNNLLYRVGLPIMAVGFLLAALAPEANGLGGFVFTTGYCYLYVIVTCVCSYFGKELRCSPVWVTALITAFLVAGQLVGFAGVALALPAGADGTAVARGVVSAAACLLPVAGLFLLDKDNPGLGWGAISPAARPDAREVRARGLFEDRGLTARETDVALLLARGLTKRYVAQRLSISEETAKSHIGNIYRKLGVHSQQELIARLDEEGR